MHAVERHVEHPRQPAFEHHAAGEVAHQVADRRKTRQRDQRAVIAIAVFRQGLALTVYAQFQRLGQQRGLLVSGLGARRHVAAFAAGLRAGGAVAEGEDIVVAGGLQGRAHLQLVDPVALQAVEILEEAGCANPRGPDLEAGGDGVALGGEQGIAGHLADRCIGHDRHAEAFQGLVHRLADPLRQCRQHPRSGFDQGDAHVFRANAVQAIGRQLMRRMVQFGGQFHARGAGADDGHADLFCGLALAGVGAQVVAEQLAMEALGLLAGVEKQAVFGGACGAEVVGGAADRDHQAVVIQLPLRHQHLALLVERRAEGDAPCGAVEPAHASELELEVIPLGLGHVVQLVFRGVQRAGGHLMQQRFPDVRQVGVDQGDFGFAAFTQSSTQAGSKLQAAGAAADDQDSMGHGTLSQGLEKNSASLAGRARSSS
ncbi:hypothetical protein D3C84_393400 [compost metagenome]